MSKSQNQMPPENLNIQREQIIVNTRLTSLQAAQDMLKVNCPGQITAEDFVKFAEVVENYILDGIQTVKPKSALVIQSQMPPPGEFQIPFRK